MYVRLTEWEIEELDAILDQLSLEGASDEYRLKIIALHKKLAEASQNSIEIKDLEPEYFSCDCQSPEHTLRFSYDAEFNEIYTQVFLDQWRPWYLKIWTAVKYAFGYKSQYGHWDCFNLRQSDVPRLLALLNKLDSTSDN